jgi:hypothetical protein
MHMIHVECDVMTVKRVEGRIVSVHSFPIFSGKQRHAIFFFCSLCSLPLLFFRYTQAGIVTFPVYLPYFSAQRCMIEIIFMPDIYENNQTLVLGLEIACIFFMTAHRKTNKNEVLF